MMALFALPVNDNKKERKSVHFNKIIIFCILFVLSLFWFLLEMITRLGFFHAPEWIGVKT